MRVICPNCERKGLIDAAMLSDAPTRAVCPRCGVPFRIRLLDLCDDARAVSSAPPPAINTHANAARVARTITLSSFASVAQIVSPRELDRTTLRASEHADNDDSLVVPDADVLALPGCDAPALPLEDAHADGHEETSDGVLDLNVEARVNSLAHEDAFAHEVAFPRADPLARTEQLANEDSPVGEDSFAVEDLFAHDSRAHVPTRRADAVDKYRLAVRVMNASPLWLVAAGLAFVALVFVFDLLLAPAAPARDDASALAAPQNQATNRDAARSRRDLDAIDADDSSTRVAEDDAPKPAAISDAAAPAAAITPSYVVASSNTAASSEAVAPHEDANAAAPASAAHLTIQIASYRVAAEADDQAAGLRAAGFDARVVEEQTSKRPWYCVQTGMFDTRADAERRLSELRAKGFASNYTVREVE
jgi:cell division septation protein DedD